MGAMEQRRDTRYTLWFPVDVETGDAKHTLAVAKDVSKSGIGVSCSAGLDVGATVTLSFKVPPDTGEQRTVSGTVTRHERNPDDPHGMWPHRIGIAFAEPIPELEAILASIAKT
jgi:hypothetical protein